MKVPFAFRRASIAILLSTAVACFALADPPPSPDQQTSCGGNCQVTCVNGCDSNASYSWQQAVCVASPVSDAIGGYCMDGYNCSSGACGRAGERVCNTAGTGCSSCQSGYQYDGSKAYCITAYPTQANHPTWMHDLASYIGNKPLNKVVIPGTHDSGTYTMVGYAQAQDQTFANQLQGGVRTFDVRPGILFGNQVIHHGVDYTGPSFQTVLNDFAGFLSKAPGEVVILNISHLAGEGTQANSVYTDANYNQLLGMIQATLGPYLINHAALKPTSLFSAFTSPAHGQAIVILDPQNAIKSPYWPSSVYSGSVWGDTTNQAFEKQAMLAGLSSWSYAPGLTHLGTELTPYPDKTTDAIHKAWYPSWLAQDGSPVMQRWIVQEWSTMPFNEISSDFYDQTCLVPIAMWLNSNKSGTLNCYTAWPAAANAAAWDAKVWPY